MTKDIYSILYLTSGAAKTEGGEGKELLIADTRFVEGEPFHPKRSGGRCVQVHLVLQKDHHGGSILPRTPGPEALGLGSGTSTAGPAHPQPLPPVLCAAVSSNGAFPAPKAKQSCTSSPLSSCSDPAPPHPTFSLPFCPSLQRPLSSTCKRVALPRAKDPMPG